MNRKNRLYCFDFNNDFVFYQQVKPVADVKPNTVVNEWNGKLGIDP